AAEQETKCVEAEELYGGADEEAADRSANRAGPPFAASQPLAEHDPEGDPGSSDQRDRNAYAEDHEQHGNSCDARLGRRGETVDEATEEAGESCADGPASAE